MLTAVAAVFVFLMVILFHELGHFITAKIVGIKVNEFSIGMGPKILQKQVETKYSIRILPIGGYVSMEGEDENLTTLEALIMYLPIPGCWWWRQEH